MIKNMMENISGTLNEKINDARQEDVRYLYTDGANVHYEQQVNKAGQAAEMALAREGELAPIAREANDPNYHQDAQKRYDDMAAQLDEYKRMVEDLQKSNAAILEILENSPSRKLGRTLEKAKEQGKNVLDHAQKTPGVVAGAFISMGNKVKAAAIQSIDNIKASVKGTFDKIGEAYDQKKEHFAQLCNNLVQDGINTVHGITSKFHAFKQQCVAEANSIANNYYKEKQATALSKAQKYMEKAEKAANKVKDIGDERI